MQVPLFASSEQSRSLPLNAQRCVNMFAEREPVEAKSGQPQVAAFGCPGLTQFSSAGTGPIRGMHVMNDQLYAVSGSEFYSISSMGVAAQISGPAITGTGVVSMADNGMQICIANSGNGYIYQSGALSQITSPAFSPANTVTFFDTYFVFDRLGTQQFFISAQNDGTTFSGLDFASKTAAADNMVAVLADHEQLILFGEKTTEFWYDAGALDFPFARYTGSILQRGLVAPLATVQEDNSVFFLADDLIFYRLNGYVPMRVSTHATEHAWAQYPTQSDATCYSYTLEGHKFVVLTFPTGNATWVFDISTNMWHERESWDANNNSLGRWRGNCFANAYGNLLIGDAFSGQIGIPDLANFTEYGNTMRGLVTAPPIHRDRKRIFMSRFELDVESGDGLTTGQGSNPQIMLDWSDDGARTFKTLQKWNSMGVQGAYQQRLRWLRMGQSRNRTIRLTVTDPVRRVFLGAYLDVVAGT